MKPENVKEAAELLSRKDKLETLRSNLADYGELWLAPAVTTLNITIGHLFEDWQAGIIDMIEAEIDRIDDQLQKLNVELPVKPQEGILGDGHILTLTPIDYDPKKIHEADWFKLVEVTTDIGHWAANDPFHEIVVPNNQEIVIRRYGPEIKVFRRLRMP